MPSLPMKVKSEVKQKKNILLEAVRTMVFVPVKTAEIKHLSQ
jgi:hypothetical protein